MATAGSALTQLARSSLRDQAKAAIRVSINTGQLEPGEIYSIPFFTQQLGVSATPIREALLDLASENLIEVVRNRGYRVPRLSEEELDDVLAVRLMLEVPAAIAAVDRMSEADFSNCARLADEVAARANGTDLVGFIEFDREFHLAIVGSLRNDVLTDLVRRLRDRTRLLGMLQLVGSPALHAAADEHKQILQAIRHKERTQVRDLVTHHLAHIRGMWAGRDESVVAEQV